MPPNQLTGQTAATPGICAILSLWASGIASAKEVLRLTTTRETPAPVRLTLFNVSIAAFIIASRKTETETLRIVRAVRRLLLPAFLNMSLRYFITPPPGWLKVES